MFIKYRKCRGLPVFSGQFLLYLVLLIFFGLYGMKHEIFWTLPGITYGSEIVSVTLSSDVQSYLYPCIVYSSHMLIRCSLYY